MISIVMDIISWGVIAIIFFQIYKKQAVKPKILKAVVVLVVGLFTFTFNFEMFNSIVRFPILPLGVWLLYWIYRNKEEKWQVYRLYAWTGFFAHFIFLVTTMMIHPLHDIVYSKNDPATFISNVDNASIQPIHPSANNAIINQDKLLNEIQAMQQSDHNSVAWYDDVYMSSDTNRKNEKFPYHLVGTTPKWGSGIDTLIYVENDGKGLLITTAQKQYYFRSQQSFLEGGEHRE